MIRPLIEAPRWLLLATIVYAPWAYGCTEDWAITHLNIAMGAITGLWLVGCAVRRLPPALNRVLLATAIFLLAQGWLITFNAKFWCAPQTLEFFPIKSFWEMGPGTADRELSLPAMIRLTGLVGILAFASDLVQRPRWRARLWWTLAGTGVSVILFGIVQRLAQAPKIFWEGGSTEGWHQLFFATYYYHANAGAFINLVLPLVAGLASVAFLRRDPRQQTLWMPALFITIAGAFVNVSKAALVIALLLAGLIGVWQWRRARRISGPFSWKMALAYGALAIVSLCAIGAAAWDMIASRWQQENWVEFSAMKRALAAQVCLRILPDAGVWGFGPGTFQHVFPHYTGYLGDAIAGYWKFAHQDYLQTLIEWGWIGWIPLALLLFGGIARAFYFARKAESASDQTLLFASGAALTGIALHGLVDFPMQIASLQFYSAILLGIGWSRWTCHTDRPRAAVSPDRARSQNPVGIETASGRAD